MMFEIFSDKQFVTKQTWWSELALIPKNLWLLIICCSQFIGTSMASVLVILRVCCAASVGAASKAIAFSVRARPPIYLHSWFLHSTKPFFYSFCFLRFSKAFLRCWTGEKSKCRMQPLSVAFFFRKTSP